VERVASWPLAWLLGVWLQLQQAEVWPWPVQAALAAAGLLGLLAIRWLPRHAATLLGALALVSLAAGSTAWRADQRLAEQLPAALEGQDLQVAGRVASLPQSNLAGTRFVFEVESATHQGRPVTIPQRLSLGWWRGPDADALLIGPGELRAGQRWRFTVRLRQPHGHLNPHGFDAELWLFEQGLRATGYVRSRAGDRAELLAVAAGYPVERLRQAMRDRIDAAVPDAGAAGVLAALAIGDQGAIDRADWELFRITGVAHLMSISGLHVTHVRLAGRRRSAAAPGAWSPRTDAGLPAPRGRRAGAGWLLATAYARAGRLGRAGAAHGVDARRGGAAQCRRALAGAADPAGRGRGVTIDPWALLQPGFWLSFVAVGLLIASEPVRGAPPPTRMPPGTAPVALAVRWPGPAHAGRGHRRPGAADAGLLPAAVAGGHRGQPGGDSGGHAAHHAAGAAGRAAAAAVDAGRGGGQALLQGLGALAGGRWSLGPPRSVPAAPAWASAAGAGRRRAAGAAAALARAPAGLPLMLPLLAPAVERPAPAASSCWRWTSGRAPRCWCARATTCWSTTPGRCTGWNPTPGSACWCRCCARAASRAWTC
jgi:competence protein ComEC